MLFSVVGLVLLLVPLTTALPPIHFVLHALVPDNHCLATNHLFNLFESLRYSVLYMQKHGPFNSSQLIAFLELSSVPGCSLHQANHTDILLNLLQQMADNATTPDGYSVVFGPMLAADCKLVFDWVAQGKPPKDNRARLFQVCFACRSIQFSQKFVYVNRRALAKYPGRANQLASLSTQVRVSTMLVAIDTLLRYREWLRVVLIYEQNVHVTGTARIAQKVVFMLTNSGRVVRSFILEAVDQLTSVDDLKLGRFHDNSSVDGELSLSFWSIDFSGRPEVG